MEWNIIIHKISCLNEKTKMIVIQMISKQVATNSYANSICAKWFNKKKRIKKKKKSQKLQVICECMKLRQIPDINGKDIWDRWEDSLVECISIQN